MSAACDVVVIGGGGAGLMCAIEAGRRGRRVMVLEHSDRVGKKIAISGGGRCNFTNIHTRPEHFLSVNPDFCKSALARYTPWDFLALVEKHRIGYHEKKLGQQFCNTSSRAIVEMLLAECAAVGVEIRTHCEVAAVSKPERFRVETNLGALEPHSLVIATGGLSFPKLGASEMGYRIARQFELKVTPLRPALVPLKFSACDAPLGALSGVSLPVVARSDGAAFAEDVLFTHRGLSGPAILQISSYWREGGTVYLDLLPDIDAAAWLAQARKSKARLATQLGQHWPQRLAEAWCARHAPAKPLQQWNGRELTGFAANLQAWPMEAAGTEGYAKAEVTLGGVDTVELFSKTMEARKVPGLYFIGEVVDVTGWLGGYNFQWAWASGHAAGQCV